MRLQKYLADAGIASRRKCEELICAGRVRVNGEVASIGASVEDGDEILLDGAPVKKESGRLVYAFYKPKLVVSSMSDPERRPTVADYFKDMPRVYNVGRLDYDSEGLLLMTNDGELAYHLTHPKFMTDKTYFAVCTGELTGSEIDALKNGVPLEDGTTAPAAVRDVRRERNGTSLFITIHEGKNRQIRRMLAYLGHRTLLLRRVSEGPVKLGGLHPGERRELTGDELAALTRMCGYKH